MTLNRSKSHYVETDGQTDTVNLQSWVKTRSSWVGFRNSLKKRWGKKAKLSMTESGHVAFHIFYTLKFSIVPNDDEA